MSQGTQRRLAAIVSADVVGYSRLMGADETATIAALRAHRAELIDPKIAEHDGRIVKTMGDGLLLEFSSVVNATRCMIELQQGMAERNQGIDPNLRIVFRIGVNLGDVVIDGDDILGDGVNVAARLQEIAAPGGISISRRVQEDVRDRLAAHFENCGEQTLKNIARPIQVWRWLPAVETTGPVQRTDLEEALPAPEKPSIIVLPFDTMSGDPAIQFVADGFCEDLTTALSKIDNFAVVSRTAAFAYKGQPVSAVQAGRRLGANFAIEGSVRSAGSRVRINAQLIDVDGGQHLWADKFDGSLDDVFEFQDDITQRIVAALEVRLSDGAQVMLWRTEAGDPGAYEMFLSARAAYKEYSRAGNARARQGFAAAVAISPRFVSAVVGQARTHLEAATFGWSANREDSLAAAKQLLHQALELNPDHALAHTERAHLFMVQGSFEAAREEAACAIAIDPNLADAHHVLSAILVCLAQPLDALKFSREAIRLNPGTPEFYRIAAAEAHIALAQYGEAITILKRVEARRPSWIMVQALLAISYMAQSRPDAARAAIEKILAVSPRFTAAKWRSNIFYPDRPDVTDLQRLLIAAGLPE